MNDSGFPDASKVGVGMGMGVSRKGVARKQEWGGGMEGLDPEARAHTGSYPLLLTHTCFLSSDVCHQK